MLRATSKPILQQPEFEHCSGCLQIPAADLRHHQLFSISFAEPYLSNKPKSLAAQFPRHVQDLLRSRRHLPHKGCMTKQQAARKLRAGNASRLRNLKSHFLKPSSPKTRLNARRLSGPLVTYTRRHMAHPHPQGCVVLLEGSVIVFP